MTRTPSGTNLRVPAGAPVVVFVMISALLSAALPGSTISTARSGVAAATQESAKPLPTEPDAEALVQPAVPQTDVVPEIVPTELPGGGTKVFANNRFLVAYYGTAHSGSLGVLGEDNPDAIMSRLRRAARPFKRPGEQLQLVYELIVSVADASPGKDGDFSHDIRRKFVQEYVDAARRNKTLLILDIQPGRAGFLTLAKHWEWALKDPWVGLALDPEWRMARGQVPGRVLGSVSAAEVNRTAAWLSALTTRNGLPEKIFMLHQFRTSMIRDIKTIVPRPGLAMVQHVDGFGPPGSKLDTYHLVARPRQFTMGFKLFYDEDRPRMRADDVRRVRPIVRYVSFQ